MSEKIIESIKAGKFDHKELANLYANAERLGRTEVLPVAKEALKELNTRAYAKIFVKPIRPPEAEGHSCAADHRHPFYELVFAREGTGTHAIDGVAEDVVLPQWRPRRA